MRLKIVFVVLACALAFGQEKPTEPKQEPSQPTPATAIPETQSPNAAESKLPAPVLRHPVASLKEVKNIYLEPMANDLDQYIKAELSKQLSGRIAVALKPEDADAILTGTGEWHKGTAQAITGRWLGLHDTATGAVSLVTTDKVIWSSEAGDRSIWWGVMARGGQRKVATRLVHNLKNALNHAK